MTRCYAEERAPLPGSWIGAGIASLDGEIRVGDEVTEEHLRRPIGHGQHPATGEHVVSCLRTYQHPETGKRRSGVAGLDMTFAVPKSASIQWAVADAGARAIGPGAHDR